MLVHGFRSNGATWTKRRRASHAARRHDDAADPRAGEGAFAEQAAQLHSTGFRAPGVPFAVGHSNGGLVAREWSKLRPLSGLLTLSSPNQGAPIANNALAFAIYNAQHRRRHA